MIKLFFRRLSSFLFQPQHHSSYIPIISETTQIKVQRLLNDKSNNISKKISKVFDENSKLFRYLFRMPLIDPTSNIAMAWYLLVVTSIIYYYVQLGLVLTYGSIVWQSQLSNSFVLVLDSLTILVLSFDILGQFCLGFIYKGMLIMDRMRIVQRYLKSSFLLDSISVLVLLISICSRSYNFNWAKLWTVFYLYRLSVIDGCFIRKLNIHRTTKTIYIVLKLMIIIFLFAHVIGLIFYAMDEYLYQIQYYGDSSSGFYWIFSSTAWNNIYGLSWQLQYMYSLYWGMNIVTTICYGDIAPNNPIETVYATAMFCVTFMMYGYVVNQIVSIIIWARGHKDQYRNEMVIMENYMEKLKVQQSLKRKVREYLQFTYKEGNMRDYQIQTEMKSKLPTELRNELLKSAYHNFNMKLQIIFKQHQSVSNLLFYLVENNFTYDQVVFEKNNHPSNLYYLHHGYLFLELQLKYRSILLSQISINNSLAGQLEFFTREEYQYTCKTRQPSLIYMVSYDNMIATVQQNISLREQYQLLLNAIYQNHKYSQILYYCYFCGKEHDYRKCPERLPIFQTSDYHHQIDGQLHQRYHRVRVCSLKLKKNMEEQKKKNSTGQRKLLSKIEKRIMKIKKIIQEKDRDFETDTVHDWDIFNPQCNLANVKQTIQAKRSSISSFI